MTKGRPCKKPRNISGLRNQQPNRPSALPGPGIELDSTTPRPSRAHSPDHGQDEDTNPPNKRDIASNIGVGSEIEQASGAARFLRGSYDEEFGDKLREMAVEDDPKDSNYHPKRRRGERILRGRPKTFAKGPDVMSKSKRTQGRYRASFKNQAKLDNFFFSSRSNPHTQNQFDTMDITTSGSTSLFIPQCCQRLTILL